MARKIKSCHGVYRYTWAGPDAPPLPPHPGVYRKPPRTLCDVTNGLFRATPWPSCVLEGKTRKKQREIQALPPDRWRRAKPAIDTADETLLQFQLDRVERAYFRGLSLRDALSHVLEHS